MKTTRPRRDGVSGYWIDDGERVDYIAVDVADLDEGVATEFCDHREWRYSGQAHSASREYPPTTSASTHHRSSWNHVGTA